MAVNESVGRMWCGGNIGSMEGRMLGTNNVMEGLSKAYVRKWEVLCRALGSRFVLGTGMGYWDQYTGTGRRRRIKNECI